MSNERAWFIALLTILLFIAIGFKVLAILFVFWLIYQIVKAL